MSIRPAVAADALRISALMRGEAPLFTRSPTGEGAEPILESMNVPALQDNLQSERFRYWVHETDELLNGVIGLKDGKHLYHLFVRSDRQRQGVGSQLWRHLLSKLPVPRPAITVNASLFGQRAYERFGFTVNGPRQEHHGVAFIPMIFYPST